MDIKVGLTVTGQWIKSDAVALVSSSKNIYHCSFDFSSEWESYTKTAVFCLNSGDPIETPVNLNDCVIPWEALQNPGILFIGVYGILSEDDEVVERYPTVWTKQIKVLEGVPDGIQENAPSSTQWEQFVVDVKENADIAEGSAKSAMASASDAESYAKSASESMGSAQTFSLEAETHAGNAEKSATAAKTSEDNAATSADEAKNISIKMPIIGDNGNWFTWNVESGEYTDTGKPSRGASGSSATISVGSTTTGTPGTQASVTNSGTNMNVILDFTIPKGEKGDKGDKGDTGDAGVVVKYKQAFSAQTTVSILASTHGCGIDPVVNVWITEGDNYIQTFGYHSDGYKVSCDASGNITITFNSSSSGKVVIC